LIELEITEADRATVYLYEDLVNLDLPVTVKVNGNVVIDKEMVKRDWKIFEKFCMPRHFFLYPFVARLDLEFPLKPRVEVKPPEEKPDEEKPDGKKAEEDAKGAPATR